MLLSAWSSSFFIIVAGEEETAEEVGGGGGELTCSSTGVSVISTSPCSSCSVGRGRQGGERCVVGGAVALLLLLLGLGAFWMTSTIGVRPGAASSQFGFPGLWNSSSGLPWRSGSDIAPGWQCTTTLRCSTAGS